MLAERAPFAKPRRAAQQLLRVAFSILYLGLTLVWPANLESLASDVASEQSVAAVNALQSEPAEQAVATPNAEASESYPPSNLRFESDSTTVLLWQPPTLASSRIIPQGLVLSFLCDTARHCCSGVQLS